MADKQKQDISHHLPICAEDYINKIVELMHCKLHIQEEVYEELAGHFADALRYCKTEEEKQQKAQQLIADFGDVEMMATLISQAKKRCRSLLQKVIIRAGQLVGIYIAYVITCVIISVLFLLFGKPTISTDYVKVLNETARAGRDESQNAWNYYQQALELYQQMPDWLALSLWPAKFSDSQFKELEDWVQSNQETFRIFTEAAEYPDYWNVYQSTENTVTDANISEAITPDISKRSSKSRQLALATRWKVLYEIQTGNIKQALDDSFALIKFGYNIQGQGLYVEQLVGFSIETVGYSVTWHILENAELRRDELANLKEKLENLYSDNKPAISLEAEKLLLYDIIQRSFTDNGKGNGRLLKQGLDFVTDSKIELLKMLLLSDLPDRQETLDAFEQLFSKSSELFACTPLQLHNRGINKQYWLQNITYLSTKFINQNFGYYSSSSSIIWRQATSRRANLTILALKLYEKKKGQYPESLDELVSAGYLKELPEDPYSGNPLVYFKTSNDFVLYSIGENFRDDGGQLGQRQGRVRNFAENGDWLYWPVQD